MARYTVVWHYLAQEELAETWLKSADREGITKATDAIDRQLASDPENGGTHVSEQSRELTVSPLQVLFRVRTPGRLVRIFSVTQIDDAVRKPGSFTAIVGCVPRAIIRRLYRGRFEMSGARPVLRADRRTRLDKTKRPRDKNPG